MKGEIIRILVKHILFVQQACLISGFRPEIIGFFFALPAVQLSCENLWQNHKNFRLFFFFFLDNILNSQIKLSDLKSVN